MTAGLGRQERRGTIGARGLLLAAGAIFALALALRALALFALRDSPLLGELLGDGIRYDAWAREIAAGDWIGHEVFYQAPLYPYFLAVVYSLAGPDPMAVRAVQAVLGASACVFLLCAGRRFLGAAAGLAAAALLAVYPVAIFYDGLIEKSALDLWLMTGLLACMGAFLVRRRTGWLLALGVLVGALSLNRENARVLVAVLVPWLLLAFGDAPWRRRSAWAALFVLAFAATLAPVAWRNQHVGGEWFVSTSQLGPNFYIGNHAGSRGLYDPLVPGRGDARVERLDAERLAEQALGRPLSPGEVSDYWLDRALDDVRAAPLRWLRLLARKLFLTFHDSEPTDSASLGAFAVESPLLRALDRVLGLGVVVPLAVLGLWTTRAHWRRLAVLYGMLAALAASVALFFVFARYRYPMLPILLLFAGSGGLALATLARARGRGLAAAAPGLAAAAAAALVVHWPLAEGDRAHDEITWFNVALGLDERGRPEDALRYLDRALALEPRFGLAHFHRARLLEARDRDAEAERAYALAVRYAPEVPDTHYRYGACLVESGRLPEGIAQLREAVALLPDSAPARKALALALARTADVDATLAASREALRVAPDDWEIANNLAWILATRRDPEPGDAAEAVSVAERARAAAAGENPQLLDTLAVAYAAAGRFDRALATVDRALALATRPQDAALARELEQRRALFLAGERVYEPPPGAATSALP